MSDIEFLVTRRSAVKQTDAFGKPTGTLYRKTICAWLGHRHKEVEVEGRRVITPDGTVIHDQGTHSQAVAAAKNYLARQF